MFTHNPTVHTRVDPGSEHRQTNLIDNVLDYSVIFLVLEREKLIQSFPDQVFSW